MNHCLRAIHAWCDAALTRRERSRTSAPGRTATTPPRNRATSRCILSENTKLERHAVTHAKRNTRWHLDLLWRPPSPLPPLQHSKAVFRSICSRARRVLLLRSETEPRTLGLFARCVLVNMKQRCRCARSFWLAQDVGGVPVHCVKNSTVLLFTSYCIRGRS